jgi:hypothetical protein
MTSKLEKLFRHASKLPPDQQDELAERWLADVAAGDDLPQWLRDNLDRVVQDIDQSYDGGTPWDVVRDRLRARFGA